MLLPCSENFNFCLISVVIMLLNGTQLLPMRPKKMLGNTIPKGSMFSYTLNPIITWCRSLIETTNWIGTSNYGWKISKKYNPYMMKKVLNFSMRNVFLTCVNDRNISYGYFDSVLPAKAKSWYAADLMALKMPVLSTVQSELLVGFYLQEKLERMYINLPFTTKHL